MKPFLHRIARDNAWVAACRIARELYDMGQCDLAHSVVPFDAASDETKEAWRAAAMTLVQAWLAGAVPDAGCDEAGFQVKLEHR